MPIYEYYCECNREKEIRLSFEDTDQPQICECGRVMKKKISVSNFYAKPTGRGMALDTLNSNVVGDRNKAWAESAAAQGL